MLQWKNISTKIRNIKSSLKIFNWTNEHFTQTQLLGRLKRPIIQLKSSFFEILDSRSSIDPLLKEGRPSTHPWHNCRKGKNYIYENPFSKEGMQSYSMLDSKLLWVEYTDLSFRVDRVHHHTGARSPLD